MSGSVKIEKSRLRVSRNGTGGPPLGVRANRKPRDRIPRLYGHCSFEL